MKRTFFTARRAGYQYLLHTRAVGRREASIICEVPFSTPGFHVLVLVYTPEWLVPLWYHEGLRGSGVALGTAHT